MRLTTLSGSLLVLAAPIAVLAAGAGWKLPVQAVEEFGKPGAFDSRPVTRGDAAFLASSCADLARGYDLPMATNLDARESAVVRANCAALVLQLSAREPAQPAFQGYALIEKSLDELPPCFEPMVGPDEQATDTGTRTLRQTSKTVRATAEKGSLRLRDEKAGYDALVRLAGRGDVNADGLDDLIVRSDWALIGGTLGGSATLVLTRRPGEKSMRVVSDSGGRCLASTPAPVLCSDETGKQMRAEFQQRFDAKDYAGAYRFLDAFLGACGSNLPPLSGASMQNDLAFTAHQLGRDARCLEIAAGASRQDVSNDAEAKLQSAVEANLALCQQSIRCKDVQVSAARVSFKKAFDKGDARGARTQLDTFVKGCEESIEGPYHAWVLSDLALAANKAGDKAACSAYLDIAERIELSEYEEEASGAVRASRKKCPRPAPIPVSTPVTQLGKAPEATRTCSVSAYVIDKDPKGLNVRSEPGGKSKVLGALPTDAEVKLVGVQGTWLRLGSASSEDSAGNTVTGLPQSGWVSRRLVGLDARNYGEVSTYFLHEAPDKKSAVVGDPRSAGMPIVDCDGDWVKVELNGKAGWLEPEGQCANTRTNCS